MKVPVTIITGTLGAGKTTIIRNLVEQLPKDYDLVWLKNEYGDVNIDSEVAKSSNIATKEVLNGCLCCVLVGKLSEALKEIQTNFNPKRIIVETAGTAYPFPILDEVNKIESLRNDGLVKVIDVLNFYKLEDKSHLAKQQAQFIDLIIFNKHELVDSDKFNRVEDEVFEIYSETPKVKSEKGFVDFELVFGIEVLNHNSFIEKKNHHHNHSDEVDVFSFDLGDKVFIKESLESFLDTLSSSDFFRIKGIIRTQEAFFILNYVLGRIEWEEIKNYKGNSKITFMGKGIALLENKILRDINLL